MILKIKKILKKFKIFFVLCSIIPACSTLGCKTDGPKIEICIGDSSVKGFNCIGADDSKYIKEYPLMDSYVCTNVEDLRKEILYLKAKRSCHD